MKGNTLFNWFSAKDRLPKKFGHYVVTDGAYVEMCLYSYLRDDGWQWIFNNKQKSNGWGTSKKVAYWIKVPKIPKIEKVEETEKDESDFSSLVSEAISEAVKEVLEEMPAKQKKLLSKIFGSKL